MSLFEDNRYCWRETYLIMLDHEKRPKTDRLVIKLRKLRNQLNIEDADSNENGLFNSLTVCSPHDHAAMDIVYQEGDTVRAEFHALADELEKHEISASQKQKIQQARKYSAKLELMHFELLEEKREVPEKGIARIRFPRYSSFIQNLKDEEPWDDFERAEHLDPNTLIQVLKLVRQLCHGIAFDPASGIVL